MAECLEEVDVLHMGESPAEVGALLVVESSVEVCMFLHPEREFVDVHRCLPYFKLNFCPSHIRRQLLLLKYNNLFFLWESTIGVRD